MIDKIIEKLCADRYSELPNKKLADLLRDDIWAFEDLGSDKAQLLETIIDRLKELK